jgi:hypothetical protein
VRHLSTATVLILVADTRRNRQALRAAPAALQGFDLNSRTVLRALREGRSPGRTAIVML